MKNNSKVFKTIGASNHSNNERVENDFYSTPPFIVKELLKYEKFNKNILEPCCGCGTISKELESHEFNVTSTDLINRGYGQAKDLFSYEVFDGDIITNPPYCIACDVTQHLLNILKPNHKLAMFLKLTFLETQARYNNIFKENPPKTVYICTKRVGCGDINKFKKDKNGNLNCGSAVCYAWFVWEKGFKGTPEIKWINY